MAQILVIDDDASIRELLSTYFEGNGHHVLTAEDGAHGIGMAARHHPDVVILDMDMPVLDGHSTIRMLKNDPQMADIPVIVLTSHNTDTARDSMRQAGCTEFLSKPFELAQVNQVVTHSLKLRPEGTPI